MLEITVGNLSLGLSIASLISLFAVLVKVSMRLGALELKVDTMWQFAMRRAMSEAVSSGFGTINSPIAFTEQAYFCLEPIRQDLVDFGVTLRGKNDATAMLEIEKKFGKVLLEQVSIKCNLSYGACMLLALSVARGGTHASPVDIKVG